MSQRKVIDAKSVKSATMHKLLPLWMHAYAVPFSVLVYPVAVYTAYTRIPSDYTYIMMLLVGTVHVLTFLSCQWSTFVRIWLTTVPVASLDKATLVHVVPIDDQHGQSAVCTIQRGKNMSAFIEYHRKKYFYDSEKKRFVKVAYPVNLSMKDYREHKGFKNDEQEMQSAVNVFGLNRLDIPLPTFVELFQEHAAAPFFVFQVFCVGLWFMDEYWYYSLFTLFMLFVFESTVVMQRLRNLTELRSMAQAPHDLHVYREGAWTSVKSDLLLPGDIVSVVRHKTDDFTLPCDVLLIRGHCVVNEAMLSGESTPMMKESIENREDDEMLDLKNSEYKVHIVFAGTKVLQHESGDVDPEVNDVPIPPDGGSLGYVLRTSFGTTQGKLVRTMVHNTGRISANNIESLFFILFLLIFAIAAAYHVWVTGIENGRKTSKLLLDCILILTSVVPPELPMELSLAVNQSIIALSRFAIFCTEPFRIPIAGKVDICCFDKTGTLTEDKLVVEGVSGLTAKEPTKLFSANNTPFVTSLAVSACHSLSQTDEGLIGDPMEKAIVEAAQWDVLKDDIVECKKLINGKKASLRIARRFPFSSALKRMSTISSLTIPDGILPNKEKLTGNTCFVAVKGAPEVLRDMFTDVPSFYDSTYKHFAMNGSRVIALGWKWISPPNTKSTKGHRHWSHEVARETVESQLFFAGFLIFHCPLKKDTADAIFELQESMHRVVMITGDNPLTACFVARKLTILRRPILILGCTEDGGLYWRSVDETTSFPFKREDLMAKKIPQEIANVLLKHDICITGNAVDSIASSPYFLNKLLPRLFVYARMSPSQKELVLASMKRAGYITLMAGDGTNDVGALKQAHVGVALLDGTPEDLIKIAKIMRERQMLEMKKKQEELMKTWGAKLNPENNAINPNNKKVMDNLMEQMEALEEPPLLKLGDASVAAPFTSKLGTIMSICRILRQGRCTLVTTIQMYKILALNCLITAFCLSALYLDGIKYGDTQVTTQGFLLAGCFLFLSWGKPIDRLSKKRPQPNIFNPYILLTVLGQFGIHIVAMWTVVTETKKLLPPDWKPDLDDHKFEPNLLNTTVYLISLAMQVSTFLLNYQGRPFRESLRENKPLYYSLTGLYALAVLCAAQIFPDLNQYVELVPLEPDFSDFLVKCILADFAGAYAVEYIANYLFSDNRPNSSLGLFDHEWESLSSRTQYYDRDGELIVQPATFANK